MSQQFLHIPGLLTPGEVGQIEALAAIGEFVDGKLTASGPARAVKHNQQLDPAGEVATRVDRVLTGAIKSSPLFQVAAQPGKVYPFVLSRYEQDARYGWHVDSPLMGDPPLRTDLAMTVFLSDPATYAGGELVIQSDHGPIAFKPSRGDAILYPCQFVHSVNPVTDGVRLAAVTWIQSVVKSSEQRQLLFQLSHVQGLLSQRDPAAPETAALMQIHSNLIRMWSEP